MAGVVVQPALILLTGRTALMARTRVGTLGLLGVGLVALLPCRAVGWEQPGTEKQPAPRAKAGASPLDAAHARKLAPTVLEAEPAPAEITFTPLDMPQGNTENRTGMWFCPDLGKASDILPLKTRVWATKESVTGGVAMKCVFEKGSRGIVAYEKEAYPAGSAGITLYAKASRKLTLKVGNVPAEVGTDWKKLDFPWERLGTDPRQAPARLPARRGRPGADRGADLADPRPHRHGVAPVRPQAQDRAPGRPGRDHLQQGHPLRGASTWRGRASGPRPSSRSRSSPWATR